MAAIAEGYAQLDGGAQVVALIEAEMVGPSAHYTLDAPILAASFAGLTAAQAHDLFNRYFQQVSLTFSAATAMLRRLGKLHPVENANQVYVRGLKELAWEQASA